LPVVNGQYTFVMLSTAARFVGRPAVALAVSAGRRNDARVEG